MKHFLFAFLAFIPLFLHAAESTQVPALSKEQKYKLFCALHEIFDATEYAIKQSKTTPHAIPSDRNESPAHVPGCRTLNGFCMVDNENHHQDPEALFSGVCHPWGFSYLARQADPFSYMGLMTEPRGFFQEKITLALLKGKFFKFNGPYSNPAALHAVTAINGESMPPLIWDNSPFNWYTIADEWDELKARYHQEHKKQLE